MLLESVSNPECMEMWMTKMCTFFFGLEKRVFFWDLAAYAERMSCDSSIKAPQRHSSEGPTKNHSRSHSIENRTVRAYRSVFNAV
jgi:hypothetical protein